MGWGEVFNELGTHVATRGQLSAAGARGRMLTAAVRTGNLLRLRRGQYALPGTDRTIVEAVRVGGRLACVSALRHHGVFAIDTHSTHVHLTPNAARLRSPRNRFRPLNDDRAGVELHWRPLMAPRSASDCSVGVLDALSQALLCQSHVLAVASIDNALHLGRVTPREIEQMFLALPRRLRFLSSWVDPRSEAGQETVLRRIVHDAGLRYELQVEIPGVGRVDLLVEGCLILEADSAFAHSGWAQQVRDRRRDLVAATLNLRTLRPAYEHTMYEPQLVLDAIVGILGETGWRPR